MKNVKYVIIAIACVCLICGGFYFFSKEKVDTEETLTEVEKLIVKDMEEDYPKTPREVVKLYNRIISCYYGEDLSDEEIEKLADQMLYLFDDDLLLVNPREEYISSVKSDIEQYKNNKKQVVNTDVCSSNEVRYLTDEKEGTTEKDELAYVNASYFVNTSGSFSYTYQQFVLRQDEEGQWKILTFYEVEGDSSDDE